MCWRADSDLSSPLSSPVAKLIRAGKVSCDLQGGDDGEGGTCYPFTVSMERRVTSVEITIVKVSQKQDPKARLLILYLEKGLVYYVLFRCPLWELQSEVLLHRHSHVVSVEPSGNQGVQAPFSPEFHSLRATAKRSGEMLILTSYRHQLHVSFLPCCWPRSVTVAKMIICWNSDPSCIIF